MTKTFTKLCALAIGLAVFSATPFVSATDAVSQSAKKSNFKPLRGKSNYKYRGGYSYKYNQVAGPGRRDPYITRKPTMAPLDGDFFFEQPFSPYGGTTPYMH